MTFCFFLLESGQARAQERSDVPQAVVAGGSLSDLPSGEKSRLPDPNASQQERLKTVVDLSFTNASLKNVLSSLAKVYGLNIIADESVTGSVTLNLRGVTLEEGLRQALKLNGFGFVVRGEILEIVRIQEKRVAEVLKVKYLNPATALEIIQPLASQGAVLKVDDTAGGIVVSDLMNRIEEMRLMLEQVDQPPQQVLIESKLIDVTHTDLDNLGLRISAIGLNLPLKSGHLPLLLSQAAFGLAGPSSDLTGGQASMTIAQGDDTFTATLDALIRDKRVKVIANPNVMTMNNMEAKIIIGEKFPIREQTQTTTGTLETTRFVDVGTALRVTPRINPDGYVQMHIHPEVSSVSATLADGPRITTREADTTVVVKDGQPIVIGGLLQEDDTLIKGRIPFLAHIPLLGLLFQNRAKSHQQKELVIVITPFIVDITAQVPLASAQMKEVGDRMQASDLFFEGRAFEENLSLKARQTAPDTVRYLKAVDLYERVAKLFPTHPLALESLWRIGRVSRERLHDLDQAENAFTRIIDQFGQSQYRSSAIRQVRSIQWERSRRLGRVSVVATVEPKRQKNKPENYGFR